MAAEDGEDPVFYRYNIHADWSEDIDILTIVVIGRNCLPCKMADLCSYICYFLYNNNNNNNNNNTLYSPFRNYSWLETKRNETLLGLFQLFTAIKGRPEIDVGP